MRVTKTMFKKRLALLMAFILIVGILPLMTGSVTKVYAADGVAEEHSHALSSTGEAINFSPLATDATRITEAGNYYLTQDLEIYDNLWIETDGVVNLCLNGHRIILKGETSNDCVVFIIGGELNLCDCGSNGCITSAEGTGASGVRMSSNTGFNMYSGEISGNESYGVYYARNFNMYGGKISGNKNTGIYASGTVNIHGGEISGNTSDMYAGGVYVSSGTFTMKGGEIKNNTNSASSGYSAGGVCVGSGATFVMEDGKITGNTASNGPGGVYLYRDASFTMDAGEISGNEGYNGGVYVYDTAKFTMNDGVISGNKATTNGGGISLSGAFAMNGGEISGNEAVDGGGIYFRSGADVDIKSGKITGNKITSSSGSSGSGIGTNLSNSITISAQMCR